MSTLSEEARQRTQKKVYDLGRPVKKGQRPDFFVSHSWHDNGTSKYHAMEEVAESFKKAKGRFPTFWLDAICFDQRDLSNSLRVLPVNIQSCEKVLVLCGPTYCSRLWCIWELYTIFVFAPKEVAVARVQLQQLKGEGDVVDVPALLSEFELQSSKCYDPNEESRIRAIISQKKGDNTFQDYIRELGRAMAIAPTQAKQNTESVVEVEDLD